MGKLWTLDSNQPKKPRTPAARIGTNAMVLSKEKSKTPDKTRFTEDKRDSFGLGGSSSPAAMLIILLTYDFISPHDRYSAVFVTLPVYRTSCSALHITCTHSHLSEFICSAIVTKYGYSKNERRKKLRVVNSDCAKILWWGSLARFAANPPRKHGW